MLIVGVLGKAGAGKDTIADILIRDHSFVRVSFADPLKRICQDVFGFTSEQLWGPSEKRNEPDFRYPRYPEEQWDEIREQDDLPNGPMHLSARYALQKLGTEWGRDCYSDIWLEYAIRIAKRLTAYPVGSPIYYDAKQGIRSRCVGDPEIKGVVISDVRFLNEIEGLKRAGAKVVKVVRNSQRSLEGQAAQHRSETEQDSIPDEAFDFIVDNNGSLEDLVTLTHGFLSRFQAEARDVGFAEMLEGIGETPSGFTRYPMTGFSLVKKQIDSIAAARSEVEADLVPVEEASFPLGAIKAGDVDVIPANETPAQEHLRGLLQDRQRDVDAGNILEFDDAQKDTPPFKRAKKT